MIAEINKVIGNRFCCIEGPERLCCMAGPDIYRWLYEVLLGFRL